MGYDSCWRRRDTGALLGAGPQRRSWQAMDAHPSSSDAESSMGNLAGKVIQKGWARYIVLRSYAAVPQLAWYSCQHELSVSLHQLSTMSGADGHSCADCPSWAAAENKERYSDCAYPHEASGPCLLGHIAKGVQPDQLCFAILADGAQGLLCKLPAFLIKGVDVNLHHQKSRGCSILAVQEGHVTHSLVASPTAPLSVCNVAAANAKHRNTMVIPTAYCFPRRVQAFNKSPWF